MPPFGMPFMLPADTRANVESLMSAAFDLIDGTNAGRIALQNSSGGVACNMLKQTHWWLQAQPPTCEFAQRIERLENFMKILTKFTTNK